MVLYLWSSIYSVMFCKSYYIKITENVFSEHQTILVVSDLKKLLCFFNFLINIRDLVKSLSIEMIVIEQNDLKNL